MDDSRSVASIARFLTDRLGTGHAILSVVLASAVVTYGGVSVFVAFFVLVPMAQKMFRAANIPRRLMPATICLGAFTFTMSALPGSPSINNAIPMPYFGTTTFAAPGLGIIASLIILAFGMWWLNRVAAVARRAGEGYGVEPDAVLAVDEKVREHATAVGAFDPAELEHGKRGDTDPPFFFALLPLLIVIATNFLMSLVVLPRLDFSFLAKEVWGRTTIGAVAGIWSVAVALTAGSLAVVVVNYRRFPSLRESLDAGANSSVLPVLTVGSLVGFGAVVAALPAFAAVRDAVLSIQGGPLVSLTVAMNVLAGLTGSASGGMVIALDLTRRNLHAPRGRARHQPGVAAPRVHARVRHARLPAPQRYSPDGTPCQQVDPPGELLRHADDRRHPRDPRALCRDRTGVSVRVVLTPERPARAGNPPVNRCEPAYEPATPSDFRLGPADQWIHTLVGAGGGARARAGSRPGIPGALVARGGSVRPSDRWREFWSRRPIARLATAWRPTCTHSTTWRKPRLCRRSTRRASREMGEQLRGARLHMGVEHGTTRRIRSARRRTEWSGTIPSPSDCSEPSREANVKTC